MQRRGANSMRLYAITNDLTLGRAADYLLHLGLLGAARVFAGLFRRLLLARRAL